MGAQDFEPLRRSCGPTFVSPWHAPWVLFDRWSISPPGSKIPHRFIVAGPYIATGVPNMEPLLCVLTGGVRVENSFKKKARRRPPSGFCWLSKSGDLEVYCQAASDGLDRVTSDQYATT